MFVVPAWYHFASLNTGPAYRRCLSQKKKKFEHWTGECIVSFQFEQHGTDANQLVLEQSLNTRWMDTDTYLLIS